MPKDSRIPDGVVNPFSNSFLDTWQLWKDFRWEQHKFKYKGCISEQVALMQLTKKCGGLEEIAIAMIMQSMEHGWSGIYELKTVNIQQNGRIQHSGPAGGKLNDDVLKQKLAAKRPTG